MALTRLAIQRRQPLFLHPYKGNNDKSCHIEIVKIKGDKLGRTQSTGPGSKDMLKRSQTVREKHIHLESLFQELREKILFNGFSLNYDTNVLHTFHMIHI